MNNSYQPPLLLRHPHMQTILASLAPRKILARKRATKLLSHASEQILDCGDNVRLLGSYSAKDTNKSGLVIFIHGWEGSGSSGYILSAAGMLFNNGFNVFRLNLRDHGPSHHLNRAPFTSTRLQEVVNGVIEIVRLFPHEKKFLVGFSLGGNFVLRIGQQNPPMNHLVAISPLIDPVSTTWNLQRNFPVYHWYFLRKCKKSLRKKLEYFPDLGYSDGLLQQRTLSAMHDYFVPRYTEFRTMTEYLSAYKIDNKQLRNLTVPTHIISADDDPITRRAELDLIQSNPQLSIEHTRYGGHCGFLDDFRLHSWVDRRLVTLFKQG
jgi:predicted alpha/beta-fold hydrolase